MTLIEEDIKTFVNFTDTEDIKKRIRIRGSRINTRTDSS